jgi:hypothetical protein
MMQQHTVYEEMQYNLPVGFYLSIIVICAPKIIAFVGNFYVELKKLLQE